MTHKNYLIIGGTGGIGQAMIEQLIADPNYLDAESSNHRIFATYHNSIDPCRQIRTVKLGRF